MKTLRTIHVYLGCAFAPLLVLFLLSGLLQTFELHEGRKDGSYQPPRWIAELASVHMHQRLSPNAPQQRDPNWPMRIVMAVMCAGLFASVSLGVVMAWQLKKQRRSAMIGLLLGLIIPIAILLTQHNI